MAVTWIIAAALATTAGVLYGLDKSFKEEIESKWKDLKAKWRLGQVGVVAFCFTMVGALLGFLWHNAHPAQVFMGDTGSLAIGAALATVGFMTGQWLLLPVVGFVFVAEVVSVIL